MAVRMTTDYTDYNGFSNTIVADWADVKRFDSDGSQIRLTVGAIGAMQLPNFVHKSDLEDKSKYRKTDELLAELRGYRDWLKKTAESYKGQDSSYSLQLAYTYLTKVDTLDCVISSLEEGEEVWSD